ncbi:hypothetical protein EDB86DRAFT_2830711 [Lactarius hatsudake]|nr:hypothetical protein EDB86DRAFT_2830711 [Lactarius hatsudake]
MHPRETGALFLEDRRERTDRRRAEPGESGGPSAAAMLTQGGQIRKNYPNNQLSEGVWEFMVNMTDGDAIASVVNDAPCYHPLICKQAKWPKGKGKAREKRCHDDDIPPQPLEEVNNQYKCLLDLKRHLLCQKHSMKSWKTYCWVEPGAGHCKMEHREMTYWAKLISIGKADVTLLPNAKPFDCPSTKKLKGMHEYQDPHCCQYHAHSRFKWQCHNAGVLCGVRFPNRTTIISLCPRPVGPHWSSVLHQTFGDGPCGPYNDSRNQTRDLKYVDMTNVYTLGVEELAKIGHLDMDGAHRLWKYMEKVALAPLGLLDTVKQEVQDDDKEDEPESHDVMGWPLGGCKEEYIKEMDKVESAHKLDGSEGGSGVLQEI